MSEKHMIESRIAHQLDDVTQKDLLTEITKVLRTAPLFQPVLPRWGTPFSVLMSNCGPLGWVSDKSGYRYQSVHPVTGAPWPPMPSILTNLWEEIAHYPAAAEACLINYYAGGAKMGLHQDKDEDDFDAPVLSISLGDSARFRLGGKTRTAQAESFNLASGDVMLLGGKTRLAFHGVDRIYPGTSALLADYPALFPSGGRVNVTLRRVHKPNSL